MERRIGRKRAVSIEKQREDSEKDESESSVSSDESNEDNISSYAEEKRSKKRKMMMPSVSKGKIATKKPKVTSDECKEKTRRGAHMRTRLCDLYDDIESRFNVLERADKLLSSLENDVPFFLKCMLPSNVAHGFWLHLPLEFCRAHLPDRDATLVLEDESGKEYQTTYISERRGLSAGWRGFSLAHGLTKGDILIFHRTGAQRFKVRIVRVHGRNMLDASLVLRSIEPSKGEGDAECEENKDGRKRKEADDPLVLEDGPIPSTSDAPSSSLSDVGPALEGDERKNLYPLNEVVGLVRRAG